MRTSILLTALACAASASAAVQVPFTQLSLNSAKKRGGYEFDTWLGSFLVNLTIGTPPQALNAVISTNTADSWVPQAQRCDRLNAFSSKPCQYGAFATNRSSSLELYAKQGFEAIYQDAVHAEGNATRESLSFVGSGVSTRNISLGVVNSTNHWLGVIGLAYNASYSYQRSTSFAMPSLLDGLLADNKINSKAYSIWLDSPDSTTGQLLLGAIDTTKFTPPLTRVEASSRASGFNDFGVKITSLNGSKTATSAIQPLSAKLTDPLWVTLSPSDAISNLPLPVAQPIWALAGATYNRSLGAATIPCAAVSNTTGELRLELSGAGGPVISLHLSDLILPRDNWSPGRAGRESNVSRPGDLCMFGVQSSNITRRYSSYTTTAETRYWSIGSTMLRRTYTVLDVANQQLAVAALREGASRTESNVVPFARYGAVAPNSTRFGAVSCYTYIDETCNGGEVDEPGGSREGAVSGDGSLQYGQVVGLAVGVSLGVALLLGFGIWGLIEWLRHKRRSAGEGRAAKQDPAMGEDPLPAAPVSASSVSSAMPAIREEETGRLSQAGMETATDGGSGTPRTPTNETGSGHAQLNR